MMTLEEFKKQRAKAEELKKDIPPLYNSLFSNYSSYEMEYIKNRCKLDLLYYELEGVKGVDYTKEKGTYNKDARIEKYYSVSDEIAELEKSNDFIYTCIKGLENIRDSIKDASFKNKITECYFKTGFQ